MLTRAMIAGLIGPLIPEKGKAVVTLNARTASPTVVTCYDCWIKRETGGLADFGRVNVEQDKTVIKIPDKQLNPAGNGRNIRAGDTITFGGDTYRVTSVTAGRMTSRTVWDCGVQQEFN
jgi:hypothetical protein